MSSDVVWTLMHFKVLVIVLFSVSIFKYDMKYCVDIDAFQGVVVLVIVLFSVSIFKYNVKWSL